MLIRTYLLIAVFTLSHALLWFAVAMLTERNDVADIAWGIGFVIAAVISRVRLGTGGDRSLLVTAMVFIWAARLSMHIYRRNRGQGEDFRYLAWRQEWGKWFALRTLGQVFLLQWLLMLIVAFPVIIINVRRGGPINALDLVGAALWFFGFTYESIADRQLADFARDPRNRGQILHTGLWRRSRHPNYFGEIVLWWGVGSIAFSVPSGAWSVLSAATITLLIRYVSGVPMMEKRLSTKPGFAEYAAVTPRLMPRPPF